MVIMKKLKIKINLVDEVDKVDEREGSSIFGLHYYYGYHSLKLLNYIIIVVYKQKIGVVIT